MVMKVLGSAVAMATHQYGKRDDVWHDRTIQRSLHSNCDCKKNQGQVAINSPIHE